MSEKLKLQMARNGISLDSETKKLSERVKYTRQNSDHYRMNPVTITIINPQKELIKAGIEQATSCSQALHTIE